MMMKPSLAQVELNKIEAGHGPIFVGGVAAVYWLGLWICARLAFHPVRFSELGYSKFLSLCDRIV
jgi:hypothetical protein